MMRMLANLFEQTYELLSQCEDNLDAELYDIEYEARERLIFLCGRMVSLWNELSEGSPEDEQ